MAKQVGLFGLRGKIENKSFYKTAGVADTVIRQIPEGLSSRVKTADEYANTRLNNAEFKNGNEIATFLFNAVPNRKSSMMRRFAIAEMTKKALEAIKSGSGTWGLRIPTETFDLIAVDLLENRAKSGPYQGEYGLISVDAADPSSIDFTLNYDATTAADLIEKGIDGFYVVQVKGAMSEEVVSGELHPHFGKAPLTVAPVSIQAEGDEISLSSLDATLPAQLGMSQQGYAAAQGDPNNGMIAIFTFLPYRQVGSQRHSLYEYATYCALALGPIPTE